MRVFILLTVVGLVSACAPEGGGSTQATSPQQNGQPGVAQPIAPPQNQGADYSKTQCGPEPECNAAAGVLSAALTQNEIETQVCNSHFPVGSTECNALVQSNVVNLQRLNTYLAGPVTNLMSGTVLRSVMCGLDSYCMSICATNFPHVNDTDIKRAQSAIGQLYSTATLTLLFRNHQYAAQYNDCLSAPKDFIH